MCCLYIKITICTAAQVLVGQNAVMATPAMSALIRRRKLYGKHQLRRATLLYNMKCITVDVCPSEYILASLQAESLTWSAVSSLLISSGRLAIKVACYQRYNQAQHILLSKPVSMQASYNMPITASQSLSPTAAHTRVSVQGSDLLELEILQG